MKVCHWRICESVEGGEPVEVMLYNIVKGGNQVYLNKGEYTGKYNWEVVLNNPAIPTVAKIFAYAPAGNGNYCTRGLAIDQNPMSDFFQSIYISDPYGTKGIYRVSPELNVVNDGAPYLTAEFATGNTASPFRMGVNPNNGFVYSADWSDAHSGIYIMAIRVR